MNKKVEELSKKVFNEINSISTEGVVDHYILDSAWFKEYSTQFANAIAGECVTIAENLAKKYVKARKEECDFGVKNIYVEGETASNTIKRKIKRHFKG